MKNGIIAAVAAAAIGMFAATAPSQAGQVPESSDPIKLAVNEWTGQHVTTYIAGGILQSMGYNVEYVTAGAVPQFAAVAQGNLHSTLEVWTNNVGNIYPKAVASGDIVVIGALGLSPQEGWIYPPYMAEKCPGLPDYKALYKCAQAFANAETFPNGRLITYPADWGTRSKDVVAAIGVPFVAVPGGSEGAMIAELKSAYAVKDPILMMFWQPHWLFAELDFDWVKWNPDPNNSCVEESQTKENACGFEQARVEKVVWKGFEGKWPTAYRFLQQYELDNDVQNGLMLEIDQRGRDLKEVVAEWIGNNKSTWQKWVDGAMM